MHVLKPGEAQGPVLGPVLGPAVSVEILLEGQMVNAQVDTGSPITITSIDCLLDVFAKLQTPNQTLEEWQQEVVEHSQYHHHAPQSTLKTFSFVNIACLRTVIKSAFFLHWFSLVSQILFATQ